MYMSLDIVKHTHGQTSQDIIDEAVDQMLLDNDCMVSEI